MSTKNINFFRHTVLLSIALVFVSSIIWFDINSNDITSTEFYYFIFVILLFAVIAILYAFASFRSARFIEDIPTAKIHSAHQGYIELEGRAKVLPDYKLIAPLSKRECCWYSYTIHEVKDIIEHGDSSEIPFLLQDDTGTCLIDPKHAEITTEHEKVWHMKKKHPDDSMETKATYKYTESVLLENDKIYAVGFFQTLDSAIKKKKETQFSREILKEWKTDQKTLLQRFDENKDGKIDITEWEKAKESAESQASERVRKMMRDFPHRLSEPKKKDRGEEFHISNFRQTNLTAYHRERARITVFFFIFCCFLTVIMVAKYNI